jgi:hypothetical protein
MTERIVGKLGKLAPKRPEGLHMLAFYQTNPLPAAPDKVNVPVLSDWRMLANDKYGDCTFAGIVHARMATATVLGLAETFPTDDEIVQAYLAYTGGQDGGAVEADLLKYWQTNELFGSKLAAFAPTDHADFDELKSVIASYGLAYIGVQLPVTFQDQFLKGEPWALTGTPADSQIEGGHCVILVGYDADYAYCVSWGKIQAIAWTWLRSYMEESWAIITPEVASRGEYGQMRFAELLSDLGKL